MDDNTSKLIEDVKYALFDDRNHSLSFQFETWVGDGASFIVVDEDNQEYRVTITREIL